MTYQGDLGVKMTEELNYLANLQVPCIRVDESNLMTLVDEGARERKQAERWKITVTIFIDWKVKRWNDASDSHGACCGVVHDLIFRD